MERLAFAYPPPFLPVLSGGAECVTSLARFAANHTGNPAASRPRCPSTSRAASPRRQPRSATQTARWRRLLWVRLPALVLPRQASGRRSSCSHGRSRVCSLFGGTVSQPQNNHLMVYKFGLFIAVLGSCWQRLTAGRQLSRSAGHSRRSLVIDGSWAVCGAAWAFGRRCGGGKQRAGGKRSGTDVGIA